MGVKRALSLILYLCCISYSLCSEPAPNIRSINARFSYQKGPIFFTVTKAFLINSPTSVRLRCPEVRILAPFKFDIQEVMVVLNPFRLSFVANEDWATLLGQIRMEEDDLVGGMKVKGNNWRREAVITFRLSDEHGLRGNVILGSERIEFVWLENSRALYFNLDGVDLAGLTYFFYGKVEGSGKLRGGFLLSERNGKVHIVGGLVCSRGWLSQNLLRRLKIRAGQLKSRALPIDWARIMVKGLTEGLEVRVAVGSMLGKFRSQFFAPVKILAILKGSKEVGR